MTSSEVINRFLNNEEYGRGVRSRSVIPLLCTQVEIFHGEERDGWTAMTHATDTMMRAVIAANQGGHDGKQITGFCTTGCEKYGNLHIGWNWV